jgi:hypothetical protein
VPLLIGHIAPVTENPEQDLIPVATACPNWSGREDLNRHTVAIVADPGSEHTEPRWSDLEHGVRA